MFADPSKRTPPIVRGVVRVAAEPVVFWLPITLTPGRSMLADPSKRTPPMVRAVVNVAAEPVVFWLPRVLTPGKSISAEPLNETPPIRRAVVRVAAEPENDPPDSVAVPSVIIDPVTVPVKDPSPSTSSATVGEDTPIPTRLFVLSTFKVFVSTSSACVTERLATSMLPTTSKLL